MMPYLPKSSEWVSVLALAVPVSFSLDRFPFFLSLLLSFRRFLSLLRPLSFPRLRCGAHARGERHAQP